MFEDSSARTPLATWNPARSVWETTQGMFCGHLEPYSETWPISGSMRNGRAFERPTSAHRMGGSVSSSSPGRGNALLRTPVADEDGGGPLHPDVARERGQTLRLTGQILAMTGHLKAPA